MEQERELIYLAALLHDIGKFYQRADNGSVESSQYLHGEIRQQAEQILPKSGSGAYIHKHCLWTAQFFEDYSKAFQGLDLSLLKKLSSSHHLASSSLSEMGCIIKEADSLSEGVDMESVTAMKDCQDEESWNEFKKKRCSSTLQSICGFDKNPKFYQPVESVRISKSAFAKDSFDKDPDYVKLWKDFSEEYESINTRNIRTVLETTLNILYKYAIAVPASTVNLPDVTLYDHLKTTAALALCLYDWNQDGKKFKDPFLLIGADFSGIQSYIYQIISKYAAKNLKGRSFYLRLLSDAVVRYILKRLHLFGANIIYDAGGGFYLLAPNTTFVHEELDKLTKDLESKLFKTHQSSLYIALDYIEMSQDALMHRNGESIGDVWGRLFLKRDKKKQCKFSNLIEQNPQNFFSPLMNGGDAKCDIITGREFADKDEMAHFDSDHYISKLNKLQINLGSALRYSRFILISEEEMELSDKDIVHIEPVGLGFHYYFVTNDQLVINAAKLSEYGDRVSIMTLNGDENGCDFIKVGKDCSNNIYGFTFYGGNKFNGRDYKELCKSDDVEFSRLGVLRMDVDNLGMIFQKGISPERANLSRYAALSRSFDYFFAGYLNTIYKEVAPQYSQIIYSGGDDLFIVGDWKSMIDIAKRIHDDFAEYTCYNTNFSISGGIAIVEPDFPIMKAAMESQEEEDHAKHHGNKNSISMMDMPLNWTDEFPAVEKLKDHLLSLLAIKKLSKSFLSKISILNNMAKIEPKGKDGQRIITNMKVYWMLSYDMKRLEKESKKNEYNKPIIENVVREVCSGSKTLDGQKITTKYHALELWAFACRWAEIEDRSNKNK